MSSLDIRIIQALIDTWPQLSLDDPLASDAALRARDAIASLTSEQAGPVDVAALLRQVLLEDASRFGGRPHLRVPLHQAWPTTNVWSTVGCTTARSDEWLTVRAEQWIPPLANGDDPELAWAELEEVYRGPQSRYARTLNAAPADPFWRQSLGFDHYLSVSQRQAARAVVLSPPGSTVVVVLPTGRGKTAVVWARGLMQGGVTIVVVPTVVLALDMERRTREAALANQDAYSPTGNYAYVGELPEQDKRELREAVRSGQQRILYTSPEALVSGLAEPVLECARAGHLRQFVVDEAHLIDQWGQDFRPEFLTMAGLRQMTVDQAPAHRRPVTILMSATVTERHVNLFEDMFPSQEGFHVVWGSSLRTEPSYFVHRLDTDAEQRQEVLVAALRLPRPLVVYTSRIKDAEQLTADLRALGLRRVSCITGDSREEDRRSVVQRWRGLNTEGASIPTEVDVVVGTSAFGLGVDVSNVRSVLHACIPETIDRYYQEVGRSGRDGLPTASVLLAGPKDDSVARALNNVVHIGVDKGWRRWQALLGHALRQPGGLYRVDLTSLPGHLTEGYGRSAQWNVRTLTLMAQAGLLSLRAAGEPDRKEGEAITEWQQRRDAFFLDAKNLVDVELVDGSRLDEENWSESVERVRDVVARAQTAALRVMYQVIGGGVCVGAALSAHYRVAINGAILRTPPRCRGCPACRAEPFFEAAERNLFGVIEPDPPIPDFNVRGRVAVDPLRVLRADRSVLFLWASTPQEYEDLSPDLIARLAERGLSVTFGVPGSILHEGQRRVRHSPVISDDGELLESYGALMLAAVPSSASSVGDAIWSRLKANMPTYVLGLASLPSPEKPRWRWRDVADSAMSIRTALEIL